MYQNQTERMLADGGIMQEGGTVDEASGNEVPAGSLKEEVRDDVDAKLSVGEFVVPADVVRYIGLENLMKMRDKAKAGLKQMSDIGQMGNAEEAKDEEDVTEFSSAVDDVMGEEDKEVKMAVGGYVQPENAATYANAPLKGFEMVSLVNDAGNIIYIPYVNGKPQLSIPSGYKVKTGAIDTSATAVAPVTPATTTAGAPSTTTSDSGGGGGDGTSSSSSSSSSGLSGVVGSSVSPSTVGMVGSVVGGPIGLGINLGKSVIANALTSSIASQNAAAVAAQMGLTAAEAATPAGQAAIASAIDSTPNIGEDVGVTATTGPSGTGAAAVGAAAAAADAAAANGLSDAAQGAASQAAANASLGGANASAAATAGANAAADAAMSEAADAAGAANAADAATGAAAAEGMGSGGSDGGDSDGGIGGTAGSGNSGGDNGADGGDGGDSGW